MSEMIRMCSVCGREFDTTPYYLREGEVWKPICSPFCLTPKEVVNHE